MSKDFVKCKYCKKIEKNNPELIVRDCNEDNKISKSYIHINCKVKQLKEQDSLDKLISTIINIYNLQTPTDIPSLIYTKINQIRNGTYKDNIKYKQGYSYSVIDYAFKMASKDIDYSLNNKKFNVKVKNPQNYLSAMRQKQMLYGLAIVYSKLPLAYKELQKISIKNKLKQQEKDNQIIEVKELADVSFAPKEKQNKYDWLEG